MKNFSFMVMGDACLDRKFNTGITGAQERLSAFDEAVKLAKQRSVNYVFVTGNLFDSSNPSRSVLKHVSDAFYSLPSKVIIAPGSFDPSTVGSCYQSFSWPSNVYVFPAGGISYLEFNNSFRGTTDRDYLYSGGRETGRKGVRIYGSAFESHFCRESMLVNEHNRTPRLSSSYINVLVMHGMIVTDEKSIYNPIPLEVLKECGFDLCAIGGASNCERKGHIIVPGMLCPGSFDNSGEYGVFIGEVADGGFLSAELVSVSPVKYEKITFDVYGRDDLSPASLAEDISKLVMAKNCIRVELVGELPFDANIDVSEVGKILEKEFPLAEIVDKTMKRADLSLLNSEKSFRGFYTTAIWNSVRQARDEMKKTGAYYSEKNYESAVNLGLKIIDNMNISGLYSSVKENSHTKANETLEAQDDKDNETGILQGREDSPGEDLNGLDLKAIRDRLIADEDETDDLRSGSGEEARFIPADEKEESSGNSGGSVKGGF